MEPEVSKEPLLRLQHRSWINCCRNWLYTCTYIILINDIQVSRIVGPLHLPTIHHNNQEPHRPGRRYKFKFWFCIKFRYMYTLRQQLIHDLCRRGSLETSGSIIHFNISQSMYTYVYSYPL